MPMPSLQLLLEPTIHPDGDGCWPDLKERGWTTGELKAISALEGGMALSGLPSVTLRVETENGKVILAQTSLRLLSTAVRAFIARYGDPHTLESDGPRAG